MDVVLGIDAAWTETQPSGVAVVVRDKSGWRCKVVAPSYDSFLALAENTRVDWNARSTGSHPHVEELLKAAEHISDAPVDIVTIDMPVATVPIRGRREADKAISRQFGGRGCSAHSPSDARPGRLGASLSCQFAARGYHIATTSDCSGARCRLVEVYPHPALLALLRRNYRIEYKVSKSGRYWRNQSHRKRIQNLLKAFGDIEKGLAAVVGPTGIPLPDAMQVATLAELKKYEDALDALICCWVGTRYVDREVVPLGDESAAIWVPKEEVLFYGKH